MEDQHFRFVDVHTVGPGLHPDAWGVEERVNQRIAAAASLVQVLDFLFDFTRGICPCDRIGLAFVEEDGGRVVAHHVRANYEPIILSRGYSEDLQRSSLKTVIARGLPRIIDDIEAYSVANPESSSSKLILQEGLRSSLTCPLIVEGRTVGLLFRSSRHAHAYHDEAVRHHLAISERLSQAVEKAWRIEQLEAANRAYMEMLGFVSHELKSPLVSVVTNANLLAEGYLGPLTPEQLEKVRSMSARSTYLLGLVREYLDLARMEGGELTPNFVTIRDFEHDVIQPALDVVQPQLDDRNMLLMQEIGSSPLEVVGDPNLLRIALVNLMTNAAKYGSDWGKVRVKATVQGPNFRMSVRNDGPGFADTDRQKLFRKFSRLTQATGPRHGGTGVGLYTVWRVAQLHGGRVSARSSQGNWAEFAVTIPQPPEAGGLGLKRGAGQ